MSETAFEILENAGCFEDIEYRKYDDRYYLNGCKDSAKLIMKFISLSMPNDFRYKFVQEPQIESINSWNDELNQQFGYGLFD